MEPVSRLKDDHPLRNFFTVLAEKNFHEQLGWPDYRVIKYVADLLADFYHVDHVYPLHDGQGKRQSQVSDLLLEAETGATLSERAAHRHVGDFTLFMMGLFPEHLARLKTHMIGVVSGDALLDYVKVGKRSYRIVSELPHRDGEGEDWEGVAELFRKLSEHFELCVAGVGYIRLDLRRRRDMPFPERWRERWL